MVMHKIVLEDGEKLVRQPQWRLNLLILDVIRIEIYIPLEDKEKTTFTCPFDNFTYRRMLFDPGIKNKGSDRNFKVNEHRLKLFHESPTLEEETAEELSLGNTTYALHPGLFPKHFALFSPYI